MKANEEEVDTGGGEQLANELQLEQTHINHLIRTGSRVDPPEAIRPFLFD